MANPENLVPNSMRSPSEVRANAAKGGRKSGETRRRRKTFKELMEIAFERKTMGGKSTMGEDVVAAMFEAALAGDVKAFVAIRDTIGEKPVEKVEGDLSGGFSITWDEAAAAKRAGNDE
jgi:hypothetical protein